MVCTLAGSDSQPSCHGHSIAYPNPMQNQMTDRRIRAVVATAKKVYSSPVKITGRDLSFLDGLHCDNESAIIEEICAAYARGEESGATTIKTTRVTWYITPHWAAIASGFFAGREDRAAMRAARKSP